MLESIVKAAENFCIHQLGSDAKVEDASSTEDGALLAYIDLETEAGEKFRVYLIAQKDFVQHVAQIFLDEDASDDETIMDMALECTNLIVGSAKVIAQEKGIHFTIQTPHLQRADELKEEFTQAKRVICNGNTLFIALKEME